MQTLGLSRRPREADKANFGGAIDGAQIVPLKQKILTYKKGTADVAVRKIKATPEQRRQIRDAIDAILAEGYATYLPNSEPGRFLPVVCTPAKSTGGGSG